MKTLRSLLTVFCVLAGCVGFISCEKEDLGDKNKGKGTSSTYTGKKLVKLNDISFLYDSEGRLVKYDYNDGDYDSFEYGNGFVKDFWSWSDSYYYKANLNSKGLATSIDYWCTKAGEFCDESKHPHSKTTYYFEYDKQGRMIKAFDNCIIKWNSKGNVESVSRGEYKVTFEYGSQPIVNKMGFMLSYDELWNVDLDDLDVFTLARVMGNGTKHLPISRSDGTTFAWTLGEDGYPTSVTISSQDYEDTNTTTMTWE